VLAAIMPLAAAAGTPMPGWQLSPHLRSRGSRGRGSGERLQVHAHRQCAEYNAESRQLSRVAAHRLLQRRCSKANRLPPHLYRPGSGVPDPGKLLVRADIAGP
jgi:hypothetical protein